MPDAQMQEVHEGQQEVADARAVDAFFADVTRLDLVAGIQGMAMVAVRTIDGTTVHAQQYADETVGECVRRAMEMSRMSDTEFQCWCDHNAKAHEPKCREANGLE